LPYILTKLYKNTNLHGMGNEFHEFGRS